MRHKVRSRTLGRDTAHRLSMLRNMTKSLLQHRRLTTTVPRAKELSRFVERIINLAIKAYQHKDKDPAKALHYKRQVYRHFQPTNKRKHFRTRTERDLTEQLFTILAPYYSQRAQAKGNYGGYTRVLKLGPRKGDGAQKALIELVEDSPTAAE